MMAEALKQSETDTHSSTSGHALTYAAAVKDAPPDPVSLLPSTTKLLFVTSEMGDFVKAGGLGEVSTALPRQLRALCDVRVLIPGFRQVRAAKPNMDIVAQLPRTASLPPWSLGRFATPDGLTIYAVLCDELYDREGSPYGPFAGGDFGDNDLRFARLSLAAAELAAGEADPNWKPDVVHRQRLALGARRRLSALERAFDALDPDDPQPRLSGSLPARAHGRARHSRSRLQRQRRRVPRQDLVPEERHLLQLARHHRQRDLCQRDHHGRAWLRPRRPAQDADGRRPPDRHRQRHRRQLGDARRRARSPARNACVSGSAATPPISARASSCRSRSGPLFSIISRLVHQKGIDLSIEAAETIVADGGQLVVTGRGEPRLEDAIERLARQHPKAVAARIGFDDAEARRIFAASDFLLMPSRFEPCGLSQMYAQRSGALPIAYRTGGLVDTIEDGLSGFLFSSLTGEGLTSAVTRALAAFRSKRAFVQMREHAMAKRFDWSRPTHRYADVYAKALAA